MEGFAKECAMVTHYRLKTNETHDGVVVDPAAKLEEKLVNYYLNLLFTSEWKLLKTIFYGLLNGRVKEPES